MLCCLRSFHPATCRWGINANVGKPTSKLWLFHRMQWTDLMLKKAQSLFSCIPSDTLISLKRDRTTRFELVCRVCLTALCTSTLQSQRRTIILADFTPYHPHRLWVYTKWKSSDLDCTKTNREAVQRTELCFENTPMRWKQNLCQTSSVCIQTEQRSGGCSPTAVPFLYKYLKLGKTGSFYSIIFYLTSNVNPLQLVREETTPSYR